MDGRFLTRLLANRPTLAPHPSALRRQTSYRRIQQMRLINTEEQTSLSSLLKDFPEESTVHIFLSARRHMNTDKLQQMLVDAARLPSVTQNDIIVTNVRHYEALTKALDAIRRVQDGLASQISGDFLSQDIRECIFYISDIAGEVTNDMVLRNIFKNFCIGK